MSVDKTKRQNTPSSYGGCLIVTVFLIITTNIFLTFFLLDTVRSLEQRNMQQEISFN